ncbi:MAG: fasciclin domain-containing protein, partial [Gammaproteobacteria bacterium]|nr:fasciclin domain-containing protein [Gammaproteobacteria bacterium]
LAGKTLNAATVQGGELAIDATDGVTVNGANVVTADIETSNGVIHVIDAVLLP